MLDGSHNESQDAEITDVLEQAQTLHFHFFLKSWHVGGRARR